MMTRHTGPLPDDKRLRLYVLGHFHLEHDGKSISLPTRKTESLFAYLALHPEPHSREKLAALLWGDVGSQQAYMSLRTAIYQLRKRIDQEVVVVDHETIQLNPKLTLWVDASDIFESRSFKIDSSEEALRKMGSKFESYAGDLLSDFYDDWIPAERERYHMLYVETLLDLAQALRAQSDYQGALKIAQQVLAADIGNEKAHQHLMFCYLASGNRSAALEQYERCRQALEEEYGVDPSPDTTALAEWIRQASHESRSLEARITNLPIPVSSFIGRKRELQEIKRFLQSHSKRLLTLTGPGGSGKTRLAIQGGTELIDHFKDGVWWVELAGLANGSLVTQAVAKALGIREVSHQDLIDTLSEVLHSQNRLLILDNCEHLLAECVQLISYLLRVCDSLQVLVTSRERLGIIGEILYPVPALEMPQVKFFSMVDLLMHFDAIHMFCDRAAAIQPEFTLTKENAIAVNRICQRLDGIPLALELAAARVKHLSVEQIADRLDERFDLLTSGSSTAVPRQQTLRAAIDWSYNLLDPAERSLFCRLGIFAGGFTLDAAEAIVDGSLDLLARLVDKSLFNVTITPSRSYRYRMLESIQQYARIELSKTNDLDGLAQQHVQYYLALAQAAEQNLQGVDQVQWLDRLEEEEENLRAALQWSTERDQQTALQLAIALFWFWERRSYYREGINWLEEILTNENLDTKDSSPQSLTLHAQALWACGSLMAQLGDNKKAVTRLESAVTLFRELLNRKVDREKPETQQGLALALTYLSQALRPLGHNEQARILGEEAVSLVRGINQEWGFAFSLSQLAYIVRDQDGYAAARLLFKESLDFYRRAGDLRGIGDVLSSLGITAHLEGDDLQAEKWLEESLELGRQVGDRYQIGVCLVELAFIAMAHGDDPRAEVLTRESLSLFRGLGHAQGIANALVACAALACRQSAYDRAARMYGIIDALKETVGGIIIRRRGDGYVDLIKKAQDLLGSTLFDTEYALGRSLSTDEALKTALG